MMDTILNLGLNDEVVEGIIRKTGNARFAWDFYRRFVPVSYTHLDVYKRQLLLQEGGVPVGGGGR